MFLALPQCLHFSTDLSALSPCIFASSLHCRDPMRTERHECGGVWGGGRAPYERPLGSGCSAEEGRPGAGDLAASRASQPMPMPMAKPASQPPSHRHGTRGLGVE